MILRLHEVGVVCEGVEFANRFARFLGDLGQLAHHGIAGQPQLAQHFADHLQNFRQPLRTDYDKSKGEQQEYFEYVQISVLGEATAAAITNPMITIAFRGVNDA
jgi:hypothetical protein